MFDGASAAAPIVETAPSQAETGPRRMLHVVNERRPRTRAECQDGPRPCLFVSCRFHLYVDVTAKGGLRLNFPDLEVWELPETCALDVAERGGMKLAELSDLMRISRQRGRQLIDGALAKVKVRL